MIQDIIHSVALRGVGHKHSFNQVDRFSMHALSIVSFLMEIPWTDTFFHSAGLNSNEPVTIFAKRASRLSSWNGGWPASLSNKQTNK